MTLLLPTYEGSRGRILKQLPALLFALLVLLVGTNRAWAQAPVFTQAVSMNPSGGSGASSIQAVATDAAGNQYVTGNFTGTLALGTTTLVSSGQQDIFVAKRSAAGGWLWALRAGDSGRNESLGIAVDAGGNALVTGNFLGTATFGTGASATTLTSAGDREMFVAKFGTSTGACVWAVRAGGTGSDHASAVAVDAGGNALVTGIFLGTATFGTGASARTLTSASGSKMFVAKFGGASGTCAWAVQAGDTSLSYGIAVDAGGNALVTGDYINTVTFGTGASARTLPYAGLHDLFVAKFDGASGTCVWAVRAGGSRAEYGYGIAVDAGGNALVTGRFQGTANFGTSPVGTTLTSAGDYDLFVAKFDGASGTCAWAVRAGGSRDEAGNGIAVDAGGNALVTGDFFGTATFGTGASATTLTSSASGINVFVAKLGGASGTCAWAVQTGTGSGTSDSGRGIAVDAGGNALVTGFFRGTASFGSVSLTGGNLEFTGFVAVLGRAGTLATVDRQLSSQVLVYPNPASTAVFVVLPAALRHTALTAELVDGLGRVVHTHALPTSSAALKVSLQGVAPGVYSLRVATTNGIVSKKLVVE